MKLGSWACVLVAAEHLLGLGVGYRDPNMFSEVWGYVGVILFAGYDIASARGKQ